MGDVAARREESSYRSYEPLKEAIEKKLMTSVRDISRIITKARTRDEEQAEKYDAMVQNLLENGYCETASTWSSSTPPTTSGRTEVSGTRGWANDIQARTMRHPHPWDAGAMYAGRAHVY